MPNLFFKCAISCSSCSYSICCRRLIIFSFNSSVCQIESNCVVVVVVVGCELNDKPISNNAMQNLKKTTTYHFKFYLF